MKLSFNEWLLKTYKITENQLTVKWAIKRFGCSKEEAEGYLQNVNDEYGDYININ